MNAERRVRFTGPFDVGSGRELEQIAEFLVRRGEPAQGPAPIHIDLSRVTRLDPPALDCLNRAWIVLTSAGWPVEIEAPDQVSARWPFVAAAIRGEFAWTRGSSAEGARTRNRHARVV